MDWGRVPFTRGMEAERSRWMRLERLRKETMGLVRKVDD
jgi:hypothetical protein